MNLIHTFPDCGQLYYEQIDHIKHVYLKRPNRDGFFASPEHCFAKLVKLRDIFGGQRLYDTFVTIYDRLSTRIDEDVLRYIYMESLQYPKHQMEFDMLMTIFYASMVADEDHPSAMMKKRIKRLSVHQLLIENANCVDIDRFNSSHNWAEIEEMCSNLGF
ncbi:MAG: hypothetical protein MJ069_06905 [Salinivirgaceae bacterium]|nr:hypothetical protein [Salinivirgaceae bacterium]